MEKEELKCMKRILPDEDEIVIPEIRIYIVA